MNNISWINRQIAVSGAFTDQDISCLKEQGINAVVDIRSERADNEDLLKKNGMDYLRVKVDDTFSPSFDQLKDVLGFVEPLLGSGSKVLIHWDDLIWSRLRSWYGKGWKFQMLSNSLKTEILIVD